MILEIPNISALTPERSQQFIRQLYSLLRSKEWISFENGSFAQFDHTGNFVTGIYHFIQNESITYKKILWLITQGTNGKVVKIEVTNEESEIEDVDFKDYSNNIINRALINTLTDNGSEFYCRNYCCFINNSNLDGSYWINSKLRVSPLYTDDNELGFGLERIIVVDQLIKAVDFPHSIEISEERCILLSAYLSLFFDIGVYSPEKYISKWVKEIDKVTGMIINKRLDLGVVDSTNPILMPLKKNDNLSRPIHSVYHDKRTFNEQLSFPKETRQILKSLESADLKYKSAFDRCCRLYQTALVKGSDSQTIKFSYLYGSVDSICQTTKEFKGFSDFMRTYSPQITEDELDYIHKKIRSNHWHSGDFILGENESTWREFIFDKDRMLRSNKIENLQHLIRESILKWTFEKIVKK